MEQQKFVKGLESSKSNVFKAVTLRGGAVQLAPISMLNLCFVKHDNQENQNKTYVFLNPTKKRIEPGMKVIVETCKGYAPVTVVSSIKLQRKYLKGFMDAFSCSNNKKLRKVCRVITNEETYDNIDIKAWAEEE